MKFFTPRSYQLDGLRWLIRRTVIQGKSGGALFWDPGLGKTAVVLSWFRLLKMLGRAEKALIVAPLRVAGDVWPREVEDWEQFQGLKTVVLHGPNKQQQLNTDADIYLINPEGIAWLSEQNTQKFDVLVIDESSLFKTWGSKRVKAMKKMAPDFRFRVILTGTPCTESLEALFPQIFMLDLGESLGDGITKFRRRYFYKGGFGGYKWLPSEGSKKLIESKIAHLCHRLSREDHLDLPEIVVNDVWVDLPEKVAKSYRKLEREMFLEIESGEEIIASNAGSKYNLCRQMTGGGIYDDEGNALHLHTSKIEALKEVALELQGKPILVAFQFRHDWDRIKKAFKGAERIDGTVSLTKSRQVIADWNAGKIACLAVQPRALSHGINMQSGPGRDVVWLGLTDSLDVYQQLNARIYRQGVSSEVRIHRILARKTVDEAIADRLESKDKNQKSLLDALNEYRLRNA